VLEKLIRDTNAMPAMFSVRITFGQLAREYVELNKHRHWGHKRKDARPETWLMFT